MKLKYTFLITDLDDKKVAVPVDEGAQNFHGVINLNDTGAAIMELLSEQTTEDEIVSNLMKSYDSPEQEIHVGVQKMIAELSKLGVLEV